MLLMLKKLLLLFPIKLNLRFKVDPLIKLEVQEILIKVVNLNQLNLLKKLVVADFYNISYNRFYYFIA